MGRRVQIGHFFNGHNRKLLTAYPRMFDDEEYIEIDPGSSYHVRMFICVHIINLFSLK